MVKRLARTVLWTLVLGVWFAAGVMDLNYSLIHPAPFNALYWVGLTAVAWIGGPVMVWVWWKERK